MTKKTFNKYLLARNISEEFNLTIEGSTHLITKIFEILSQGLSRGDRVVLIGFGSFVPVKRKARKILHPKTRQPMEIPERIVPVFRPGRKLKNMMNNTNLDEHIQDEADNSQTEEVIPSFEEENKVVDIDQYL